MQPVKINIEGNYFDCQIYSGRLYLWTFDGDLKVIDWNALVNLTSPKKPIQIIGQK